MLKTHLDAERRYSSIRKQCLNMAQNRLSTRSEYSSLILKTIDNTALLASKEWDESVKRRVDWNWIEGYSSFKFRHPKRFELAIWDKSSLASLVLGRPTYQGSALRLDYIEANPLKHASLKVFPAALFSMMSYAEALGASSIRVMNPINDEVKKYHESIGLSYVPKGNYMYYRL